MATFNTAFGALPSAGSLTGQRPRRQQGMGAGQGAPQAQDAEPRDFMQQFRAQQQGQQQGGQGQQQGGQPQQPQRTFAQMQQAGQARPAPPQAQPAQPAQPAQTAPPRSQMLGQLQQQLGQPPQPPQPQPQPSVGGGQAFQGMLGQLQQQLGRAFEQPSGFTAPQFQQLRQTQQQQLQADFQSQQRALDEELARRGLFASSIGAERMSGLAGQQARAMAGLDAQLLQQQAEMEQRGRESALGTLAQVTGQLGQLGLGEQEVGIRQQTLEQQRTDAAAERDLRATMQTRDLTAQEAQQLRDIETRKALQTQQIGAQREESAAERDIRLRLQSGQITADQAQQERALEEQRAARQQQFGISQQELGLRAQQLQQEAQLQGRSLTLQEANSQAQNQLERERLAQQGQQFGVTTAEQQRQFNIQQALQQQLGLGGLGIQQREVDLRAQQLQQEATTQGRQLSLEEARLAAQREQFGISTAEQQRQFNVQQELQRLLGLGGLDIQRGQLGLETQRLEQQRQDAAAERELRSTMQTRELTAQESAQLRDIESRKALQTQQLAEQTAQRLQNLGISQQELGLRSQQLEQERGIAYAQLSAQEKQNAAVNSLERDRLVQQGQQFGLNLDEQRAGRLQQYDISARELGLRAQQLQQEAQLQGRRMSIDEAQNLAQNGLERDRLTEQARQFGFNLSEQQMARMQQGQMTMRQLALETRRLEEQARQFGLELDSREAQNQALNSLEQERINNDREARSSQLGFQREELEQRAEQFRGEQLLRGAQITNDQAYRMAEIGLRTEQIQNDFLRSGQQITAEQARIQAQRDIAAAENAAQMARLERTIADNSLERSQRGAQAQADRALQELLGVRGLDLRSREIDVNERMANNDLLLRVAQALGALNIGDVTRRDPGNTPPGNTPPGNTPPVTTPRVPGDNRVIPGGEDQPRQFDTTPTFTPQVTQPFTPQVTPQFTPQFTPQVTQTATQTTSPLLLQLSQQLGADTMPAASAQPSAQPTTQPTVQAARRTAGVSTEAQGVQAPGQPAFGLSAPGMEAPDGLAAMMQQQGAQVMGSPFLSQLQNTLTRPNTSFRRNTALPTTKTVGEAVPQIDALSQQLFQPRLTSTTALQDAQSVQQQANVFSGLRQPTSAFGSTTAPTSAFIAAPTTAPTAAPTAAFGTQIAPAGRQGGLPTFAAAIPENLQGMLQERLRSSGISQQDFQTRLQQTLNAANVQRRTLTPEQAIQEATTQEYTPGTGTRDQIMAFERWRGGLGQAPEGEVRTMTIPGTNQTATVMAMRGDAQGGPANQTMWVPMQSGMVDRERERLSQWRTARQQMGFA